MPAAFRLAIVALLLVLAVPATASAKRASSLARVTVPTCQSDLDQARRAVEFVGDMATVRGAQRLRMRFTLEVKTGRRSARWRALRARGFGQWVTSDPGVARYRYTKRVQNLVAPARYRALVRFRWIDARGRTIRRMTRRSSACQQRDLRPNLVLSSLERVPLPPGAVAPERVGYRLRVKNGGPTATAAFAVSLAVDGMPQSSATVAGFAPGELRPLVLSAPPCRAGARLTVRLDPGGVIDESRERDNVVSRPCADVARGRR